MRGYLDDGFDRALPEQSAYRDSFVEDRQKLKTKKKGPNKNVKSLIARIDKIVALKQETLARVSSEHPEGSCFARNLDKIRATFELDEQSNKLKLQKYVESLSSGK